MGRFVCSNLGSINLQECYGGMATSDIQFVTKVSKHKSRKVNFE